MSELYSNEDLSSYKESDADTEDISDPWDRIIDEAFENLQGKFEKNVLGYIQSHDIVEDVARHRV